MALRAVAALLLWSALAFVVVGWGVCLLGTSDDGLHCVWAIVSVPWLVVGGGVTVVLRAMAERVERRQLRAERRNRAPSSAHACRSRPGAIGQDASVSGRGMWVNVRGLLDRFSGWVVAHPVLWGVSSAVALVLLGLALELAPILVLAAGAAIGVLNILHARRRGYCPLPAEPGSRGDRA